MSLLPGLRKLPTTVMAPPLPAPLARFGPYPSRLRVMLTARRRERVVDSSRQLAVVQPARRICRWKCRQVSTSSVAEQIVERLTARGVAFTIHEHVVARMVADAL